MAMRLNGAGGIVDGEDPRANMSVDQEVGLVPISLDILLTNYSLWKFMGP